MEDQTPTPTHNRTSSNAIYIVAAVAAAGLIVYGAFFYTKAEPQKAQITNPNGNQTEQQNDAEQITFDDPVLGQSDAPVTMIEYGSYLCGYCQLFGQTTFKQIEEKYIKTGRVKYIFRSYPPLELGMALACAYEQGKYWDYHHLMIEKTITSEEDLVAGAAEAGIDKNNFNQCLTSGKYQKQAENWYTQGQQDGVQGTPSFLINGKQIVGNMPYEDFANAIEEALNGQ